MTSSLLQGELRAALMWAKELRGACGSCGGAGKAVVELESRIGKLDAMLAEESRAGKLEAMPVEVDVGAGRDANRPSMRSVTADDEQTVTAEASGLDAGWWADVRTSSGWCFTLEGTGAGR